MKIPIEIKCPTCGAEAGEPCQLNPQDQIPKRSHNVSYSFHWEREFQARQQSEAV
jgi:hypothetical protein